MAVIEREAPAALSAMMQSIARNYIGARQRAGSAWLETARYLAEARQAAKYGEWKIFLEATQTSADSADRLLAIHDQAEQDPQYRLAVQNNFLNVSTAYELTTVPPAVQAQLLSAETPPTRAQIREIKRGPNSAPARTFDQAEMFDAPTAPIPPALEARAKAVGLNVWINTLAGGGYQTGERNGATNYQTYASLADLEAVITHRENPFWQSIDAHHPTAHFWTRERPDLLRSACGMTIQNRLPNGSTEGSHCSSCVRATWPQNQAEPAPVGTPATAAACVRCGATRAEHRHLTSYERDLVPEYPGRSVTLCSRCIPEMLAERKQTLARLDEQLPPALFKAGYFWKAAAPPTIAHYDGWHGDAPTVEQALQLGRDHLRKKTENDPRMQAVQLLKQLEPLLLALSAPDQERLSQAISDLNECEEGTEVRHWLSVGHALLDLESTD
jgi:hypothetical protein